MPYANNNGPWRVDNFSIIALVRVPTIDYIVKYEVLAADHHDRATKVVSRTCGVMAQSVGNRPLRDKAAITSFLR